MCPSAFSNTLVMDVEGTDGRERGEDQVRRNSSTYPYDWGLTQIRISNASLPCLAWHLPRFCLSTCGNTKSDFIRAPTWASLRPYSRLTLVCSAPAVMVARQGQCYTLDRATR